MKNNIKKGEPTTSIWENSVHPPILIIGLGNPILGDDGIGWRVAELVNKYLHSDRERGYLYQNIEIDYLSLGGMSLMERMVDYNQVIIIDSISTGLRPVGTVSCTDLYELPDYSRGHLTAAHDTSLQTAIDLGRMMGAHLPDKIIVVGIETEITYNFSEIISPDVEAASLFAVKKVIRVLESWIAH